MRIVRTVICWVFACCLPLLIITSDIHWGVNEIRLYEYGFEKYQISHTTGIDKSELRKIAQHLIDYFNLEVESVQMTITSGGEEFSLFSEREIVHLQDIRSLIQLDHLIQWGVLTAMVICIFALLVCLKDRWQTLVRGLFRGSMVTLGLAAILALWAIFGFEQLFLLFHLISFSNEYWILNPTSDYLIMLFPEGFFYDAALFGFTAIILEVVVIGSIASGILKLTGEKSKKNITPSHRC